MQQRMSLSLMTLHLDHVLIQLFLIFSAFLRPIFLQSSPFVLSRQALHETVPISEMNFGAQFPFKEHSWDTTNTCQLNAQLLTKHEAVVLVVLIAKFI